MPFTNSYAHNILNYAFSKVQSLTAPAQVWIGLTTNDPEADGGAIQELSGGGYSRILIAQRGETYPNQMATASGRAITNQYQINYAKATADWLRVNGFGLFTSATGGTPFFYGALELSAEDAAAGGLLVEAGAVALFDPNSFKIEFPAKDNIQASGSVLYAAQTLGEFAMDDEFGCFTVTASPAPFSVTAGKTYNVVWDGVEYTCVAQDSSGVVANTTFIGNGSSFGFEDTQEPFAIVDTTVAIVVAAIGSTETTHSCVVYQAD